MNAGLGVHHDRLGARPAAPSDFDLVAALAQTHHDAGQDRRFGEHLVRHPLVVEARRGHGLLHVHAIVDDIQDGV